MQLWVSLFGVFHKLLHNVASEKTTASSHKHCLASFNEVMWKRGVELKGLPGVTLTDNHYGYPTSDTRRFFL